MGETGEEQDREQEEQDEEEEEEGEEELDGDGSDDDPCEGNLGIEVLRDRWASMLAARAQTGLMQRKRAKPKPKPKPVEPPAAAPPPDMKVLQNKLKPKPVPKQEKAKDDRWQSVEARVKVRFNDTRNKEPPPARRCTLRPAAAWACCMPTSVARCG